MRSLSLALVVSSLFGGCMIGDAPNDPGTSGGGTMTGGGGGGGGSGSGSGSGVGSGSGLGSGSGSGSGAGSGGASNDAPPAETDAPAVSQQSLCGSEQAITLTSAATTNGCNLAAGSTSGCPASRPSSRQMDAIYERCFINMGQSDCTFSAANTFVECPVGEINGAVTFTSTPTPGTSGYKTEIDINRTSQNGTVYLAYDAYEMGVRPDGSIAWTSAHSTGTASFSSTDCCENDLLVQYPSGFGDKLKIDLQWF